jgi:hypothetical protein
MIAVACPSCSRSLKVPEKYAGRTGKCPQCKGFVAIPANHDASLPIPTVAAMVPAAPGVPPGKPTKREADNIGTRQDTVHKADIYWTARQMKTDKEPYLLYWFPSQQAARDALLSLPCIYAAQNSEKLVCTSPLTFGYYRAEGGDYEAILAGWALTLDLFEMARHQFRQHGGKPRGTGELAPSNIQPPATIGSAERPTWWGRLAGVFGPSAQKKATAGVRLVKKYKKPNALGTTCTYEIYSGDGQQSAIDYLKSNPVTKPLFYRVVETPEGNWGCDKDGMYKE